MLGPTAVDELDKENIATTAEGLEDLQQRAGLSTPNLPKRQTITSFAGLRAHTEKNDFIIEEVADAPGFIDVAGIESPGLSSAPAIGIYVAEMIEKLLPAQRRQKIIRVCLDFCFRFTLYTDSRRLPMPQADYPTYAPHTDSTPLGKAACNHFAENVHPADR